MSRVPCSSLFEYASTLFCRSNSSMAQTVSHRFALLLPFSWSLDSLPQVFSCYFSFMQSSWSFLFWAVQQELGVVRANYSLVQLHRPIQTIALCFGRCFWQTQSSMLFWKRRLMFYAFIRVPRHIRGRHEVLTTGTIQSNVLCLHVRVDHHGERTLC